ncbi:MAG TPA: TIGR03560 family F420-dependent LLM class oxidoreductase [Anaerolineaceae bacterium]|nr:TIGR03560 family F420-dependent LLM class oxidoreductase [Anaerolineaceae bacterium]
MKISIMIEGQNGLNWDNWKKLVDFVEKSGFYGLYRSDHFTNANLPDKDSLELWVSLTYLAATTRRIKFGPLVSPISFRNPVFTARMASAVDDLSEGRLKLGLGAGWQEREHTNFGFDLLEPGERFNRFEEGLEIIRNLFISNQPITFEGKYFQLKDAILLPKPQKKNGPVIVIGGNGKRYTIPMVIKFADEWNTVFIEPEKFGNLNNFLDIELEKFNRNPKEIKRTIMTNLTYAQSEADLKTKLKGRDLNEMQDRGIVVGLSSEVINRLNQYKALGCDEIMLQWIDLDNLDGLVDFSEKVLPNFQ